MNKFGGAERVLQVLHEMFPQAPLYAAVYNRETASWAEDFHVKTTFLQNIPLARTNHEYFAWLAPLAFESLDFSEYDLVISITSEYAKGIITKPKTVHICYCLTPTRYLWSGYDVYFQAPLVRSLTKPLVSYLRSWDKVAAQRPDHYIAISKNVRGRIKKYYGRESVVIYPPVTLLDDIGAGRLRHVANDARQPFNVNQNKKPSGYFLLVARLVPYKRIDIAIEAFNELGWPLKIVGTGREYGKLKNMAGPTIEFLQNLTDRELSRYYQDCTAFIFPGMEDLGLSILEAQSFGKPVIAYRSGGAVETLVEGKTGMFFSPQTAEALMKVLQRFGAWAFDPNECIMQAEKFGKRRFKKEFREMVERLL